MEDRAVNSVPGSQGCGAVGPSCAVILAGGVGGRRRTVVKQGVKRKGGGEGQGVLGFIHGPTGNNGLKRDQVCFGDIQ